MLSRLSLRNAKRQFGEYALFFVTLSCLSAFMYAFNALIFSDTVKSLPSLELLPYLIITASLMIVLIMGWTMGYMMNYMLKRRSREFGIYMMSGISNRKISALIFYENSLVGLLAFLPGILSGILISQILEAVLFHMFGLAYMLHVEFSPPAAGLTFLYFLCMLLYSGRKNRKWIRRVQLRDLLLLDRQNEKTLVSGRPSAVGLFFLSVLSGCLGFWLLSAQPLGKGCDVLAGTVFLLLFLFGFFISVPGFLAAGFGNRSGWKYRKHRLTVFRNFTAKINSTSIVLGLLSVLFMLSITFGGVGAAMGLLVKENEEAGAFDILILRPGSPGDFSSYKSFIREKFTARDYVYGIYTNGRTDFLSVRDQAIAEMGRYGRVHYAEFQHDTCMAQSDYRKLREMLGYAPLEMDEALCYVHCIPVLEQHFRAFIRQRKDLACAGYAFAHDGIFSEPFSQMNEYGNGSGYVIIVPDDAVFQMRILYGVYAAVTREPLSPGELQSIVSSGRSLTLLDRATAKADQSGAPTVFIREGMDYLSGRWADKAEFHYLYAMIICLFYLAFILEITGAAILATQILGDWKMKRKQDDILRRLGMEERLIARLDNRQLAQLFLFPLLPSLAVSACFVCIGVKKILVSAVLLPSVLDILWIGRSFGVALALFAVPYGIYYAAARICYGRKR